MEQLFGENLDGCIRFATSCRPCNYLYDLSKSCHCPASSFAAPPRLSFMIGCIVFATGCAGLLICHGILYGNLGMCEEGVLSVTWVCPTVCAPHINPLHPALLIPDHCSLAEYQPFLHFNFSNPRSKCGPILSDSVLAALRTFSVMSDDGGSLCNDGASSVGELDSQSGADESGTEEVTERAKAKPKGKAKGKGKGRGGRPAVHAKGKKRCASCGNMKLTSDFAVGSPDCQSPCRRIKDNLKNAFHNAGKGEEFKSMWACDDTRSKLMRSYVVKCGLPTQRIEIS